MPGEGETIWVLGRPLNYDAPRFTVRMNDAIQEAAARQEAELESRQAAQTAELAKEEARQMAAQRSIDLLNQALHQLAALLKADVPAEARYSRREHRDPAAPEQPYYVPTWSSHSHWYTPKQDAWFLTTSADWDQSLMVLGESDLRVAILANGRTSRALRLTDQTRQERLAQDIIDCAARHRVVWPDDGPDLTEIFETEEEID